MHPSNPPPSPPAHSERLHALDALRAIAMLLGIALHATLAYWPDVFPLWAADDPASSPLFIVAFSVIHLFRMEAFFLMAGFFGCMLLARDGARTFASHRAKRIALPLLLGMCTVIPIAGFVWAWGLNLRLPEPDRAAPLQAYTNYLSLRGTAGWLQPMHLWFLQHLLVLYAAAILGHALCTRIPPLAALASACTSAWAWTVRKGLAAIPLTLLAVPALLLQEGPGADTQMGALPPPRIVAYYAVYFTAGWLLYRRRHDLPGLARFWIPQLILGILLAIVSMGASGRYWELVLRPGAAPSPVSTAELSRILTTAQVLAAPATAFLVVGVTGLFLRLCQKPSPTMRYISDSAYWMYIVHLPLVVALNWCLYPLPAPALVKFTLVCLAAFAIMLGTYHLFVRYTLIGVLLNGPKLRNQRAQRRAQHTEHRAAHHP